MFGSALIVLGITATLVGMWEHRHVLAAIKTADYRYADRPAVARWMGMALVLVGLAGSGRHPGLLTRPRQGPAAGHV